jgi:hypothetical protein
MLKSSMTRTRIANTTPSFDRYLASTKTYPPATADVPPIPTGCLSRIVNSRGGVHQRHDHDEVAQAATECPLPSSAAHDHQGSPFCELKTQQLMHNPS